MDITSKCSYIVRLDTQVGKGTHRWLSGDLTSRKHVEYNIVWYSYLVDECECAMTIRILLLSLICQPSYVKGWIMQTNQSQAIGDDTQTQKNTRKTYNPRDKYHPRI